MFCCHTAGPPGCRKDSSSPCSLHRARTDAWGCCVVDTPAADVLLSCYRSGRGTALTGRSQTWWRGGGWFRRLRPVRSLKVILILIFKMVYYEANGVCLKKKIYVTDFVRSHWLHNVNLPKMACIKLLQRGVKVLRCFQDNRMCEQLVITGIRPPPTPPPPYRNKWCQSNWSQNDMNKSVIMWRK